MSDIHSFEPLWNKWYVDDKPLGEGSFGRVYSAHCTDMGYTRRAAVKHIAIPRDDNELNSIQEELGTTDPQAVRQYCHERMNEIYSEFKQMDQLKGHTNIVNCEDSLLLEKSDSPGFDLFIRMELLASVAKRNLDKPFTRNEVVKLGIDICQALELLEKKKIVHRDIKPQNIFINSDGEFKLGDFGTARTISRSATMMSVKGTYAYMAPEIASGGEADFRSDIYSLGLVLYRLMNHNKSPFADGGQGSTSTVDRKAIAVRLGGETDLPMPAEADEAFGQVILKACAHSPENRYQNARAFRYALESLPMEGATGSHLQQPASIPHVSGAAAIQDVNSTIFRPTPIHVSSNGSFSGSLTSSVQASSAVVTGAANPPKQPSTQQTGSKPAAAGENPSWIMQHRKVVLGAAAAVILLIIGLGAWLGISELQNSNAYSTAVTAMERGQYDVAIEGFNKLGDYRDSSVQATEAANRRDYAAADVLFKTGKFSEASAAFAKLGSFQDAPERSLEAANEHAYQQAQALYNAGKYEEASAAFAALGSYHDAAAQQKLSDDTQDKETNYQAAIALYNEGKYAEAERAFEALDGYSNSAKWADTAKDAREAESNYARAISLENTGRYEEANRLFSALGNYKDAPAHTVSTQNGIDYDMALGYVASGEYDLAISIFNELARSGYKDAAQQSMFAAQAQQYAAAQEQLDKGSYTSAIALFRQLADAGYPGAVEKVQEAEQTQTYAAGLKLVRQGNYQQAHELFASLGDFRDAPAQAESARKAHQYEQGKAALDSGEYATAVALFSTLKGYQDADALAKEAQRGVDYQTAENKLSQRKYTEAYDIFRKLGDYSDAAQRAEACLPGVAYEEAIAKLEAGRYAEALVALQELMESYPDQFPEAAGYAVQAQSGVDYNRAATLMAERKYAEAAQLFESLGEYDGAAAKARDARYKQAVELLEDGSVNEALNIFTALGDYEGAAEQVALCNEINAAIDLYTNEKFAEAINAFTALQDRFPLAEDWIEVCKGGRDNEANYQRALQLMELKQFSTANSLFTRLGDYKDARVHAAYTQQGMDYQTAVSHLNRGEYDLAIGYLETIQDFPDASEQLLIAQNRKIRANGLSLMERGAYTEALEVFNSLGDFEDAAGLAGEATQYIKLSTARDHIANGRYSEALETLASVTLSDAKALRVEAENNLTYQNALALVNEGRLTEAVAKLKTIANFGDAATHISNLEWLLADTASLEAKHAWVYDNGGILYAEPDDASEPLAELKHNTVVYVDSIKFVGTTPWLYVSNQGQWGYMRRTDVTPMNAEQNDAYVLSSPKRTATFAWVGANGSVMYNAPRTSTYGTNLKPNEIVYVDKQVYRSGKTWHHVMHGDKWGYVPAETIDLMTAQESRNYYNNTPAYHPQTHGWAYSDMYLYHDLSATSESIARLQKNQVIFIDQTHFYNGETWYYVAASEQVWGYLRAKDVVRMNEQEELEYNLDPSIEKVGLHAWPFNKTVSLYVAPSESSDVITTFDQNNVIPYVIRLQFSHSSVWCHVYANGYQGYMKRSDLSLMSESQDRDYTNNSEAAPHFDVNRYAYVFGDKCYIYDGPGERGEAIVELNRTNTVYLISSFHIGMDTWYDVDFNGVAGVMKGSDLVPMSPEENETYAFNMKWMEAMGDHMSGYGVINLRNGMKRIKLCDKPSTNSTRVVDLQHDTICQVLNFVRGEDGQNWYHIKEPHGREGYIRDTYFTPLTPEALEAYRK